MPSWRAARSTARPAHRHHRIVATHQLAVGKTDLLQRREVLFLVEHVPGQPHDVLGPAVRFLQDREDVFQGLPELPGEVARLPLALAAPADLAGDEDQLAARGDAVGETLGPGPARRLQDLHGQPLSLKRCTLPVSVRGSASMNSTMRGYLYGAMTCLT